MDFTPVTVTLLVSLVAWRMYARLKRLLTRQEFHRRRSQTSAVVFSLLALLMLASTVANPSLLPGSVAGAAIGIGVAFIGLRLTRFEVTPAGFFYTPSAHIGIVLSIALLVRIGYRVVRLNAGIFEMSQHPPVALGQSALTLALVGMLFGYYATYTIGLLRWRAAAGNVVVAAGEPQPRDPDKPRPS
jgi:hypothetical protein